MLSTLEWPPDRYSLLTTQCEDSNLWVVPMMKVNFKTLTTYLADRRFDRVVGFQPTGWSLQKGDELVTSRTSDTDWQLHSSGASGAEQLQWNSLYLASSTP